MSQRTTSFESVRQILGRVPGIGSVESIRTITDPIIFIGGLFLLVELGVAFFGISELVLPAPSVVFESLLTHQNQLVRNAIPTAQYLVIGFLGGGALGILLALALYLSSILYRLFFPLLVVLYLLPKITLAPIFLLWIGVSPTYYIITTFLFVFFAVLENTLTGLRGVSANMMDLAALYQSSKWFRFRYVQLPAALPAIGAGLKIGVTSAAIGIVLAEIVAPIQGLGSMLMLGEAYDNTPLVFATIVTIAIVSVSIYMVIESILDRIIFWREMEGPTT